MSIGMLILPMAAICLASRELPLSEMLIDLVKKAICTHFSSDDAIRDRARISVRLRIPSCLSTQSSIKGFVSGSKRHCTWTGIRGLRKLSGKQEPRRRSRVGTDEAANRSLQPDASGGG
jgi:hypothetical protein